MEKPLDIRDAVLENSTKKIKKVIAENISYLWAVNEVVKMIQLLVQDSQYLSDGIFFLGDLKFYRDKEETSHASNPSTGHGLAISQEECTLGIHKEIPVHLKWSRQCSLNTSQTTNLVSEKQSGLVACEGFLGFVGVRMF